MPIDFNTLVELSKITSQLNENSVRIEHNLMQKGSFENTIQGKSYTVQLGDSTLVLSNKNNSKYSKEENKKLFEQLMGLDSSKSGLSVRGGGFLPRWPRHRRLSPKLAPNQGNPGGGDRPRSSTTLSSKPSQSEYQPDGYSEEQIQSYRKNPRYSELAQDPQLMGQECSINPKSEEEACTVLQAENEGLVTGAERTDLKAGDPNYDYKTTTPTRFTEIKVPRDSSLKDAARLGRKSGLQQGNDGDVTLLVNLMRIQPEARAAYAKTFLEAAGGENVIFINN